MIDREKVMWSLSRCSCGVPDACSDCRYDNWPPRICVQHLTSDAYALLKAQEQIEARLHLCESCKKQYPECDATPDGVMFGSGVGYDNIIGCTAYVNRWMPQEPRVMTLDEACNADCVYYDWRTQVVRPAKVHRVPHKTGVYRVQLFGDIDRWEHADEYGEYWRCWTSRPSDEQREAVKWDADH